MIQRREFIAALGGAAALPLAARGQQQMPVIGYLSAGAPESGASALAAFRKGLSEIGFVEGRNVSIEYRWGYNSFDRMAELTAHLIRRRVAVIAAIGATPARTFKAATTTIPIVFLTGGDPVQLGLVASLNRPGGNVTGFTSLSAEITGKRLGILHELIPRAARFAMLVDPTGLVADSNIAEVKRAALSIARQVDVVPVTTNREIEEAFAGLVQRRTDALLLSAGTLLSNRRVQIVSLAAHHRLPALYTQRDAVEVGGLMSYGHSTTDGDRQIGLYTGRILKGEKPADLPVMQPTKFEFVINLQTARLLGLDIPPGLLAIADEAIE
jgi:putative ABC transport system substrate-binding protein